jgi:flagellar basal-body rod modification protein FlgD
MNTFLTLLTTQLKYQDPLDPMDTAEFTNQLVQYSSVEQAIQTNQKLDSLLSMNIANLGAQAVSYIGKVAQVLGNVMPLEGGKAKATYTLDKNVVSTTIVVKDMNGNIVYSEQGKVTSGTHEFTWDGKDSNGNQLEDGAYKIEVSTKVASGETAASVVTTVFGRVTGVASDSSGVYVGLGDAVTAGLGDILTVRNDDYFNSDDNTTEGGDEAGDGDDENTTPPEEGGDDDSALETAAAALGRAAGEALKAATFGLL